jgi:hypothetical protein
MANTNGMRHPMTALQDGEFGGERIAKGRVFDALTLDTAKKLKEAGYAAIGDLTEHQDLSVSGLNTPNTAQVVNGRARVEGDGPVSAPDGATDENTGRPGLNNVPAVPELQKSTDQANADAAANVPVVAAALQEGGGKDPAVIGQPGAGAEDMVQTNPVEGTDQSGTHFEPAGGENVVEKAEDEKKADDQKADKDAADETPAHPPRVSRSRSGAAKS